MSKIERKFHGTVPHNKLRLHSAERNTSWGKVFKEYKKSLTLLNETNSSNLGFKEITKSRIFYDLKQYDSSYHYSKIALDKLKG